MKYELFESESKNPAKTKLRSDDVKNPNLFLPIKTKLIFIIVALISFSICPAFGQEVQSNSGLPAFNVFDNGNGVATYSLSLQILALMTFLTVMKEFAAVPGASAKPLAAAARASQQCPSSRSPSTCSTAS